jgi:hypothetical protein
MENWIFLTNGSHTEASSDGSRFDIRKPVSSALELEVSPSAETDFRSQQS